MARVLDAAVDALASDPKSSMAEIARRAGVARATVYVHFPTREALIAAVTDRAMSEVTQAIQAAEPERGHPADALRRVVPGRRIGRLASLDAPGARPRRERRTARRTPAGEAG